MRAPILALALVPLLAGCGGGSSRSPTAAPTPVPSAAPAGAFGWRVTQRFVSVSGPDNCWVREQRARLTGSVFPDLPMEVIRSGASITLESTFFQVNYSGTTSGSEFTASGVRPLDGGGRPCADGTSFQQMPGASSLTGRFSADDQAMTATEVNSYRLTTGEAVVYTWDWQAARRN